MSVNISHIFVRYPEIAGAAQAMRSFLTARAKEKVETPKVIGVATGTPWIGIYAWGNSAPPAMAQYLSRALEADALWFGLAGRSLAYRIQKYKLGRRVEEKTLPPELFATTETPVLPEYPDAEREVFAWLGEAGIPNAYRFLHAEELGASAKTGRHAPDGFMIGPSLDSKDGIDETEFNHRPPPDPNGAIRTMFDRFDADASTVEDDVVLRGSFDAARARSLFDTLQGILRRRRIPGGWKFRYVMQSPAGGALLEPLLALHAAERRTRGWEYDLVAV